MITDTRSLSGRLVPAQEPQKTFTVQRGNLVIPVTNSGVGDYATGTGPVRESSGPRMTVSRDNGATKLALPEECCLWNGRYQRWREEFDLNIAPRVQEYWKLWRNEDTFPAYSVGQEWRDRTTVPSPFKWIETRIPRKILALFGGNEWYEIEGVEEEDEHYEALVHRLLATSFDLIGSDEPAGRTFIERMITAERYAEIMGHVWYEIWWRTADKTLKARMPDSEGRLAWVKRTIRAYDNIDLDWMPITALAVDLNPRFRRWSIKRVCTSLEALQREDATYRESHGEALYPGLPELEAHPGAPTIESNTEPDLTEGWPLERPGTLWADIGETPVEVWHCWDNVKNTLTKIAQRSIVLDKGLAPTPDGLDPFFEGKGVNIPDQVYGDSTLNWTGPLANRVTRLGRMRMDETALGIHGQFVHRENVILGSNEQFQTPGGHITLRSNGDPSRPLAADFDFLRRTPMLTDAIREAAYASQEAEATCAADPVSQGVEATQKSREVTATEVDARMTQGSGRYQLENLEYESGRKKRMLYKAWLLLQTHLESPRRIKVNGKVEMVDLTMLERSVHIKVGGGLHEVSRQARLQEIAMWSTLAEKPTFAPWIDPVPILEDLASLQRTQAISRYIKRPQQVEQEGKEAQLGQILSQLGGSAGSTPSSVPGTPSPAAAAPATAPVAPVPPMAGPEGGGGAAELVEELQDL